ncbi:MAG: flagellar biosynthesis anti-sigma factor FlgM [Desulfovibrio sp.]|jgi:negative regulator of flagellin synthesis FlgM|nr:flagellar biosynthesis anti-sigma factor FlgM [Desulfovibrio sp.]
MEIKGIGNLLGDSYSVNFERKAEQRGGATSPEGQVNNLTSSGDRVSVSQDALLMTEARRTAQNAPDVRADKVEALRIQVANGAYKPDSKLIAQNLLREEPGLFRF